MTDEHARTVIRHTFIGTNRKRVVAECSCGWESLPLWSRADAKAVHAKHAAGAVAGKPHA